MCFTAISTSNAAICREETIVPKCGHAVHSYPCFLKMVTHGSESLYGSQYRGRCRYCHDRLDFDKLQKDVLHKKLGRMTASVFREMKSPNDIAGYVYYLLLGSVDIFGASAADAPYLWHKALQQQYNMNVPLMVDQRIIRELGRHPLAPHFDRDLQTNEITRIAVSIAELRRYARSKTNDSATVHRLLEVTDTKRIWITEATHPLLFACIRGSTLDAEDMEHSALKASLKKVDPNMGATVHFTMPTGKELSGVVKDIVIGAPFGERRYQVCYNNGAKEFVSKEQIEAMKVQVQQSPHPKKEIKTDGSGTQSKRLLKRPAAGKKPLRPKKRRI